MKNPDVIVREVDDGAVLLHLSKGIYFGLDPLGLKIWNLVQNDRMESEIIDLLFEEYDVSKEQLKSDLDKLLTDLKSNGLLAE